MEDTRIDSHNATVHQTDHYTEEQIRHLKKTASRQARIIARLYFNAYPTPLTPSQAKAGCRQIGVAKGEAKSHTWPLTSVRARITELTDAGILSKTGRTAEGEYGRPENYWIWKAPNPSEGKQLSMIDDEPQPKSRAYQEGRL